jgi:dihydroorotase
MGKFYIKNALIVNENKIFRGNITIENEFITDISKIQADDNRLNGFEIIDAKDKLLIPGIIDEHVHFREPGLTHKGDIYTESKAAIAGGVTSIMDMPNTKPAAITLNIIEQKLQIASETSLANFSFYLGASNDNIYEVLKADPKRICGIKIFLGSSTGNMLVNDLNILSRLFAESPLLIAAHCEDEEIIKTNLNIYKNKYGDKIPVDHHNLIRTEEACIKSTSFAIDLALRYNTQLNVLHISTARELKLFDKVKPVDEKKITAEVCPHYLIFDNKDYETLGPKIKCNPSIKTKTDRDALTEGLLNNSIDTIASDHAPHTVEEKQITEYPHNYNYFLSASGIPMIQHSLPIMLELYNRKLIPIEKIVEKMCHNPSLIYKINKRGFIRKGYYADLVLIDPELKWTVSKENILYKCSWSPLENKTLQGKVTHTFVNGNLVYHNDTFNESKKGLPLTFNR